MKVTPGNAQDIGTRESQQDSFALSDPNDGTFRRHGGLFALIANGMGGLKQREASRRITTRAFLAAYDAKAPDESIPKTLERATRAANRATYKLGKKGEHPGEIGITLAAIVLYHKSPYGIAVGDSPLQYRQ